MKTLGILILLTLLVPNCKAEARWCDIVGHGDNDKLIYPPIARAAHVSGTVLLRVTYTQQGQPTDVAYVSGPRLLARYAGEQLKTWHLTTTASGAGLCQSLAILDFRFVSGNPSPTRLPEPESGSIFRISVEATAPIVEYARSDPAPKHVTELRRFLRF